MNLSLSGLTKTVKQTLIDSEVGRLQKSEFYLTNLVTEEELQLCMPPESVSIKTGANFRSFNVVELGEIKFPKGDALTRISWQGILPDAAMLLTSIINPEAWDDPQEIIKDLERWKSDGNKLRLLITETPINLDCYIKSFDCEPFKLGHWKYSLELVAAVDLIVRTVEEADALKAQQEELRRRPRKKSKLGRQIREVNEIFEYLRILNGDFSWEAVEIEIPEPIIWG